MSTPSYQEQILDKYFSFEAAKDCFAITRIQSEINSFPPPAMFNEGPAIQVIELQDELTMVLSKYPDVIKL